MDTPIFDMTLSRPLPRALIRFFSAWSGVIGCRVTRCAARRGRPGRGRSRSPGRGRRRRRRSRRAARCGGVSRASPDSTIRPTRVRVFSLIRWWCTAPVSSSDGIGIELAGAVRGSAVGQDDEAGAVEDRRRHLGADLGEPVAQAPRPPARRRVEPAVDDVRGEPGHVPVVVDVHELGQVLLADHRERQHDLAARGRAGVEQVLLGAGVGAERGDQLLADRVQRRVGDLREQLGEVVEDQPRLVREHGDRGVGAHRADRLGAGPGHRREDDAQLLFGVAEGALAGEQVRRGGHAPARGRAGRPGGPGRRAASPGRGARRRARP